jgi:tetratricopeptide (TPR) repeat protein
MVRDSSAFGGMMSRWILRLTRHERWRGRSRRKKRGAATSLRVCMALLLVAGALCGRGVPVVAQEATSQERNAPAIQGVVRDAGGKAVAGATVRAVRKGVVLELYGTTAADGAFLIAPAEAGTYLVSAAKATLRSREVEVTIDPSNSGGHLSQPRPIMFVLDEISSQGMEFSDSPNFTIAAVTDWTAAGGHGSDAILRTSESLTRDAVQLKGEGGNARAVADPALKQAVRLETSGEYAKAREMVRNLLTEGRTADRLRLAGQLDEKLGDPVAAVNELEQAVREDGSEENYFEWGSELLLHRAILQAKDVFGAGAQRYPKSARMLTALGAALFASSNYDDAAQKLCEAADLDPEADEPYLFLGKAEIASPNPLRCSEDKLAEFVRRHPENPLASYYDAMAIWKQSGRSSDPQILERVEALLDRAVALDPKCGDAYLQLGNLSVSRRDNVKAMGFFGKAIEANPQLAEAHYRLGMAYDRIGERDRAKREFQLHEELDKAQAAEIERKRREVKQFLVKGSPAETPHP